MTLIFKPGPPRWPAAVAMAWNVAANGNSILSSWFNAVARALTQVSYQQLRILSQTPRKDRTNKHYSWTLLAYPPAQETPSNTKRKGSSPPQQNPSLYCNVNQFNSSQTAVLPSVSHLEVTPSQILYVSSVLDVQSSLQSENFNHSNITGQRVAYRLWSPFFCNFLYSMGPHNWRRVHEQT